MTLRLGILGSTRGTVMQSIIDAVEDHSLDASINLVISDKQDAFILQRAQSHSIASCFIDPKGLSRDNYDALTTQALEEAGVDLILLIGYMRILSKTFVEHWHHKVINVHPSLLPKHGGLMDKAVHQSVLEAGDTESGCTIHYVEEAVDAGKTVLQKKCGVSASDTVDTLKEKVQRLEKEAFIESIQMIGKNK